MSHTRREALATGAKVALGGAALTALGPPGATRAAGTGPYVVALGTQAGPALVTTKKQPALALVVGDRVYLVDAGYDVVTQLRKAFLPFPMVRHLLFTHYHSDHIAGYPALLALGQQHPQPYDHLDVWGTSPLARMHADVLDFFAVDDASRQTSSFPPMASKVSAHEFDLPRTGTVRVLDDDLVTVTAAHVFHGDDVPDACAYRFDLKRSRTSVVFSGDTFEPDENLIALMAGADLLVHEAMSIEGIKGILGQVPAAQREGLKRHLLESHTDVRKLPAIAKRAGVGHVALTHYTPVMPARAWRREFDTAARKAGYTGGVTPLDDLDTISVRRRKAA